MNKIKNIILFGGSRICAELAIKLKKSKDYDVNIFTCQRQINEKIYQDGKTLGSVLKEHSITFISTEDINSEKKLIPLITNKTLGIGLGEPWSFSKSIINKFEGRLVDLMGVRLPQYRGGAHYTWQILRKNKIGACNIQIVNEETKQGIFDSGEIIKTKEYFFPPSARTPSDYFDFAVKKELEFIFEFLDDINNKKELPHNNLQESFSIYFHRLSSTKQGYIDWKWDTTEIENFICGFDEPYTGAMTFIQKEKVYLKDCYSEFNDGPFHPFQSGIIYKINNNSAYIATKSGTLIVGKILNNKNINILNNLNLGIRLYTPYKYLEESMLHSTEYSPNN